MAENFDYERWIRHRRVIQTEEEWRSCDLPHRIFRLFKGEQVSRRKALLLASAFLRRQWEWPDVVPCRWAVEVMERQADEVVQPDEARAAAVAIQEARLQATSVMGGMWWQASSDSSDQYLDDAWVTAQSTAEAMVIAAGRLVRKMTGLPEDRPEDEHRADEERAQCDLIRCVLGNPFRSVILDPAWRNPTVVTLAHAAYQERELPSGTLDPVRLAVLADALEDAGCTDPDILSHCRQSNEHCRGCWLVDLLIGKG